MMLGIGLGIWRTGGASTPLPLVTNGGFDDGATGWSLSNGAQVSQAVVGGRLQLTATAVANNSAYQVVSGLTVGASYQLTGTAKKLSASITSVRVAVYDTAPGTTLLGTAALSSSNGVEVTGSITFTAPADGAVSVSLYLIGTAATGLMGEFDNISLVKL